MRLETNTINNSLIDKTISQVKEIIDEMLQHDRKLCKSEDDILCNAMEILGLVVPSNYLGAKLLLEELKELSKVSAFRS